VKAILKLEDVFEGVECTNLDMDIVWGGKIHIK
jgi:hypothetical protein